MIATEMQKNMFWEIFSCSSIKGIINNVFTFESCTNDTIDIDDRKIDSIPSFVLNPYQSAKPSLTHILTNL